MLNKLLEKLTTTQRNILGLSLIFIGTILIWFFWNQFLYQPKKQEIEELKTTLEQKKAELENMKLLHAKLTAKLRIKAQREAKLRTLEKGLPPEEYIPTLLTQIESLATELRAEITSFTPSSPQTPQIGTTSTSEKGETQPKIEYKEMTLPIPFQGTYNALKNFLNRLAEFPLVIVVNNLQISTTATLDEYEGTPLLTAQLPTTVYILPPTK